jgi:site-specific recombinase XerD
MRTLSQHNQQQLLESISERSAFGARDQAMIRFAVNTGLRVSELVGLVVAHVCGAKPNGQGRMVRHTLDLPGTVAKGGRARTIPLNPEARQAVLEILQFNYQRGFSVAPAAPLFPNREHRAMSTRAVRRMLENHCERADLDQAVRPHDLRHSFGSRLVERDVPTRTVQVLMGHVRVSSTQRYLHANADQLAAAVARLA